MIRSEIKGALVATGLLLAAVGSASAATIQHTGSFDGDGNHLYQLFGSIGATSLDTQAEVDARQIHGDQYWQVQGSGTTASTMVFEISANSGSTNFGIFDRTNSNVRVELWNGAATQGNISSAVTMTLFGDGSVFKGGADTGVDLAGNNFGYYIEIGNQIFYSDEALNPGGSDQMVAFQGTGEDITVPGFFEGEFGEDHYMLAWEDILASLQVGPGGTDNDYNDLIVLVESVNPVPEPGTLAVLGLGLLGLGLARRRSAKA